MPEIRRVFDDNCRVCGVRNAWRQLNREGIARVELANAISEYLEIWHNRQRRHSALGMMTPVEFEARRQETTAA